MLAAKPDRGDDPSELPRDAGTAARSPERAQALWPLALITASVAALIAVPAVARAPHWLDQVSLLVTGRPLIPAHAFALGLAFALVARGVLLRRRAAWYGLVALVSMGLLAVLAGDDALWRLPLLAAALVALWLRRDQFTVRPHPERVRTALKTFAFLAVAAVAGSVLLGGVSIRSAGRDVASGLGSTGAPIDGASWLPEVLGLAGAAGLLVLVVTLLAPDPAPPPGDEGERGRVAHLVARPGSDTLAPFALRRDKAYVFSPDGRAAIGYRVLFGVAVAGGDPVGDRESQPAAVEEFLALCRRTGWRPAVLGASSDLLPAWGPLRSFGFGDEVIVRPGEFTLSGRQMRNVRQAVKRTENAGVTTEILPERDLTPELRDKLLDVASRSLGGGAERGFSMNLDELLTGYHPGVVAVAYDEDKEPIAFQRYAVAGEGISLDAMRRSPDGPNGVNERLIVEIIQYAAERGHEVVSLNFAAFRELLESEDRSPVEKAGYQALHLLDPLIAVESLYLFNRKFRPGYKSRSIVFRSWFDIAWLAAALLTLEFARSRTRARPVPALDEEPAAEPAHHFGRS
ncbi:bifunctional lysylphosphatidylglycerol flippase/synthetase MprF [Actinomadura fibrosa]|uniref:Bifunctional lysylphosphatidylglycerol flippase/synthetase MprF n=1 Tax=Actinomadura fibrosa TaxID=111802 RepID=A0ABW2XYH7_9ACTN|nr:phosphatidylglycerol lysyltransferase domain-containing protein [Actinomadura fibrosa]